MLHPVGAEVPPMPGVRTIEAKLSFALGGGRTFLRRQSVPYPFHITRPHRLDAQRPELVTLILQSAAGGLYRGDRLGLDISLSEGAEAQVTSQAATVVHAAAGQEIVIRTRLSAAPKAVLLLSSDPYILFPGTLLSVRTDVTLSAGATVILAEGFATHDPDGRERPFTRLATHCRVSDVNGRLRVDEQGAIDGADFLGPQSPLGRYRAMGSVTILGEAADRFVIDGLERHLDRIGALWGATLLPNGAGLSIRLLALEGGVLARALDAALAAGFEAAFGRPPPARRR